MKKAILILSLFLGTLGAASAQTGTSTQKYEMAAAKPATVESLTAHATKTGDTFTAKDGTTFDVWKTAGGKYFIIRISSKTGNPYKVYVTTAN